MSTERKLHCWKPSEGDENGYSHGTCLLPIEHDGPHVFTPNEQIQLFIAEPIQSSDV